MKKQLLKKLPKKLAKTLERKVKELARKKQELQESNLSDLEWKTKREELSRRGTNYLETLQSLSNSGYYTGKYTQMYSDMVARGKYGIKDKIKRFFNPAVH